MDQAPSDLVNGFVRPFWQTQVIKENGQPVSNGIPLGENSSVQQHFTSSEGEHSDASDFLLNHQQRLENSMVNAVRDNNLLILDVTLSHYTELLNLDTIYGENHTDCETRKPVNFLPLVVAADLGNYEAINVFLSRGFALETPHDVLCKCETCQADLFRISQKRLDVYRALANPVYISITSIDPFITTFELMNKLQTLAFQEDEYEKDYLALAQQCCQFSLGLLDECRTSREQNSILNYPGKDASDEDFVQDGLGLINCAISYNQKEFVAHPFCQHLIMQHIFGDITGWRTSSIAYRALYVFTQVLIFPFMAVMYIFFPFLSFSRKIKRPLIKFINHTASFIAFLCLLAVSSHHTFQIRFKEKPSFLEMMILMWILGIAWSECIQVHHDGIKRYLSSGWNWMDMAMVFFILGAYILWAFMVALDLTTPGDITHDIILSTADGMYSFGVIASFFRLVYLCQISRYLGLLQLSLSRMVRVIFQFAFISIVMLVSFSVAMTTLFSASFEAYGKPRPELQYNVSNDIKLELFLDKGYHNLLTTMVTMMWASLDMVDLKSLDVFKGQSLIQFWTAAQFTLYHVASMIVLLNMLIAMMSNSYQQVENNIETEYKFARTQLWADYIGDSVTTLPPPFNLLPTPKFVMKQISKVTYKFFGFPKTEPCFPGHRFKVYDAAKMDADQKKQEYKNTVRELLRRYWARRRRENQPCQTNEQNQLVTMHNIKDEVSDMLSEIRNILKARGRARSRDQLARLEEMSEKETVQVEIQSPSSPNATRNKKRYATNHTGETSNNITTQDSNHNTTDEASALQEKNKV